MDRAGLAVLQGAERLQALRAQVSKGSSRNLDEARGRVIELYRRAVRSVPFFIERFNLEGVINRAELRSKIMKEFRKHTGVSNPKVLDMLVIKGLEDLQSYLDQSKQRHHLISQFVIGREGMVQPNKLGIIDHGESEFLKKFLQGNSF